MIELPEAVVLARQVEETLAGRSIANVIANASPHKFAWYTGDPLSYPDRLIGKTLTSATAWGNHVEIRVDEMRLAVSTPIRWHAPGEARPVRHQLLVEFTDGSAISCTVQMWGALLCLAPGEDGGLADYNSALLKPSPLETAFDRAYFDSLFSDGWQKLSAKAFLATEQRIPGLGNGVLQDLLWTARVHPRRRMGSLSTGERTAVYAAVKDVLAAMVAQGGRDTERDLFGCTGGYRTILSQHTVSRPCPACGTVIRKEPYLGGSVYYCPSCQPLDIGA